MHKSLFFLLLHLIISVEPKDSDAPDDDEDAKFFPEEEDWSSYILTQEEEHFLIRAEEEALRGAPPVSPLSSKKQGFYVVYCGRKTGIFQTWYALILAFIFVTDAVCNIGLLHERRL